MEIYQVNGITIYEDSFAEKIIAALENYKFATLQELSFVVKARQRDIKNVLDKIIIAYIKENPDKSYVDVCMDLHVRSEFIEELIKDGRLEVADTSLDEIKVIEEEISKVTSKSIKDIQRKEAIYGLQDSMAKPKVKELKPRFYTIDIKKK